MQDFKNLKVWQDSHQLVLEIYKLTTSFPKEELYGLVSQLRRSAVSIPNNIAEGCGRGGQKELANFLNIAMGSACEVEYLLLLALDLKFLMDPQYQSIYGSLVAIKKMLTSLIKKVRFKTT